MDKDRVKGKLEDMKGRVKRQAGEWTDNEKLQGEGAADQVKGKAQNAVGKVKDAARDASDKARDEADRLRGKADRKAEEHDENDRNRRVA
jgi:uncharacterized protein YjbJ (UPF0337 family)